MACLPCFRIQVANFGSHSSIASANSFLRHSCLWNGHIACMSQSRYIFRHPVCQHPARYIHYSTKCKKSRSWLPSGTLLSRTRLFCICCIWASPPCFRNWLQILDPSRQTKSATRNAICANPGVPHSRLGGSVSNIDPRTAIFHRCDSEVLQILLLTRSAGTPSCQTDCMTWVDYMIIIPMPYFSENVEGDVTVGMHRLSDSDPQVVFPLRQTACE